MVHPEESSKVMKMVWTMTATELQETAQHRYGWTPWMAHIAASFCFLSTSVLYLWELPQHPTAMRALPHCHSRTEHTLSPNPCMVHRPAMAAAPGAWLAAWGKLMSQSHKKDFFRQNILPSVSCYTSIWRAHVGYMSKRQDGEKKEPGLDTAGWKTFERQFLPHLP